MAKQKKTQDKTPKGEGSFSAFGAADNIRYRKYQNRMALSEDSKSVPLSKEQWLKTGRPEQ